MRLVWIALSVLLVAGCGTEPGPSTPAASTLESSMPEPSAPPAGYVVQVNALCRDLLAEVLTFDIGNAVTIEQFLGKHEPLVAAISAFDAEVDAIEVTAADRPAADAFDAYRRFSDSADAEVVAAAETGDAEAFEAANVAYLEKIHDDPAEIEAMRAAGIQCNAR